ncbi:MAG: hypothetical protein HYV26_02145 [Candidatus Hydrogenedentes bacterium]|nr:hypothetical protein [Candidatus Hydrogenedentota bacterium]MBI3119243.1 hypothetical protein [Candidatus Hydrogenedentota bacterium]
MKYVLYMVVACISFLGALAGMLAVTGNLSSEALQRVAKSEEAVTEHKAAGKEDPLGPLAQSLKQKEDTLKKQEQELKERESRVEQREKELNQLRTELEGIRSEINTSLDEADSERQKRLETVANTLAAMDPDKAAGSLSVMPEDEAAAILNLVEIKERGKIMDAMKDQEFTSRVLQALQEAQPK